MSGYTKTFKDKDRDKNNKLMFFRIDYDKKIVKPFGLWLKTCKILNWMLYQSVIIYIYKNRKRKKNED